MSVLEYELLSQMYFSGSGLTYSNFKNCQVKQRSNVVLVLVVAVVEFIFELAIECTNSTEGPQNGVRGRSRSSQERYQSHSNA